MSFYNRFLVSLESNGSLERFRFFYSWQRQYHILLYTIFSWVYEEHIFRVRVVIELIIDQTNTQNDSRDEEEEVEICQLTISIIREGINFVGV